MGSRRRKQPAKLEKKIDQTCYLTGKRRGAILKEEAWFAGEKLVKYSLAYINPRICGADNGRVLGYDNSHNQHHRHYVGRTRATEFSDYESLVEQFENEVKDLWRREDEAEQ
ncbi:MAG: DUF6516 family protein [Terriglobales bacterium]